MNKLKQISPVEGSLSHVLEGKDRHGLKFQLPVVDVRDGDHERDRAERIRKAANRERGSRYIPRSKYHYSKASI